MRGQNVMRGESPDRTLLSQTSLEKSCTKVCKASKRCVKTESVLYRTGLQTDLVLLPQVTDVP